MTFHDLERSKRINAYSHRCPKSNLLRAHRLAHVRFGMESAEIAI